MKTVAVYVRVSTEEQAKEGTSIHVQISKLTKYCDNKEWKIYRVYKDEAISGKNISQRPDFSKLLNDAKQGKFSAIVITKFDRAFRNVKEALNTLDDLQNNKIDFVSIGEDIDTTTAMGKFFFLIISGFAELERNLTKDRNKSIMENKFENGMMIGRSHYGYRPVYKDKKNKKRVLGMKIYKKEADIVKKIFQMKLSGRDYKEICKETNLKPQQVYNILRNRVYCGIVTFEGIEKKGLHDALISEEDWRKVNS